MLIKISLRSVAASSSIKKKTAKKGRKNYLNFEQMSWKFFKDEKLQRLMMIIKLIFHAKVPNMHSIQIHSQSRKYSIETSNKEFAPGKLFTKSTQHRTSKKIQTWRKRNMKYWGKKTLWVVWARNNAKKWQKFHCVWVRVSNKWWKLY